MNSTKPGGIIIKLAWYLHKLFVTGEKLKINKYKIIPFQNDFTFDVKVDENRR